MTDKNSAKFAFYYLLSLATLIFLAISVGLITFGIINLSIPDPSFYNYGQNNQFKFAISALIIAAPLYYLITNLIRRGLRKGELLFSSSIRRWLIYFILFISALIILGVLISTINSFLSGELTQRFVLKALTVFLISGLVFCYYFYDIKQDSFKKNDKTNLIFLIVSLLLVLAAFVSVWFFMESPKVARNKRLDQLTLNSISNLESSINYYYSQHGVLPDSLEEIITSEDELYYIQVENEIEYKKIDENSFDLCADFKTDSQGQDNVKYLGSMRTNRTYQSGYNCFPAYLWESQEIKKE